MKLNLNKVPIIGPIREQATYYAVGKAVEKFNEVIAELEKFLKEKQNYSNYKYWEKFNLNFFDSKTDRENIKEFRECIKNGTISQEHIDYIAGTGRYKDRGLLDYIKKCKREKFIKILDKLDMEEDEIIKKAKETEKNIEKNRANISVPKSVTKKFEKQVEKILKEELDEK